LPLGGREFEFGQSSHLTEGLLMAGSVVVGLIGITLAWHFYQRDPLWALPKRIASQFSFAHRVLVNKYYVDEFYNATFVRGTLVFARALSGFAANIIDGLVNLTRHITVFFFGYGSSLFDRFVVDGAVNGLAYTA